MCVSAADNLDPQHHVYGFNVRPGNSANTKGFYVSAASSCLLWLLSSEDESTHMLEKEFILLQAMYEALTC